jgi:hypothetical protein
MGQDKGQSIGWKCNRRRSISLFRRFAYSFIVGPPGDGRPLAAGSNLAPDALSVRDQTFVRQVKQVVHRHIPEDYETANTCSP